MNNENQENERPLILTAPACLTLPGFGFLIALNPDWRFASQERNASRSSSVSSRIFGCATRATTITKGLPNSSTQTGRWWMEYDKAKRSSGEI